ncbi:MAG: DUF563 domain-containing protein [Proteobacteria bacterium]|nr:MAG: DUF563 domain-containing protein [Pseudomonadota bacterium]
MPLPSPRPAVFILARSNVALSGYRALIGINGEYTLDEAFTSSAIEEDEIGRLGHPQQFRNELIGFENANEAGIYKFQTEGKKFSAIDEPVICLSSNEAPNFGSFLFRIFPKLVEVAKLDVSLKILVPMYFPALRQFLLMAGISESRLLPQYLDHIYLLRQAIVPSMRNRDVWFDDESIAFYDQLRLRHGTGRKQRRVYLSRRDFLRSGLANGRVMINEEKLLPELEKRG